MSIITAYFDCTDILKPYLFKYLETTALDLQRPHQGKGTVIMYGEGEGYKIGGRGDVKLYPYKNAGGKCFSHAEGGTKRFEVRFEVRHQALRC